MSTLRDSLSVDPPVTQTASFRFGALELAAIDDKIRACEEHLVRSLIRGAVAPNYLVRASSPNESLLTKGAAVCCAGTANPLEIDAATEANLVAQSGRIVGLLLTDTGLGNYAAVVVAGVVPGALTGLGTGTAGPVYVDGSTARLTRTQTSYQVGTTDAVGNVLLGGASGGGGGSVVFSGDLAGNAFAQSVRGFYGKTLAGAASVLGQLYVYNGTAFELQTATATATANALVKADGTGKIAIGYIPTGQTSTTVPLGNDARFSDSRTPTAHATSHKHGGSDEIATATAAANAIPKAGATGTLAVNWLPTGTSSATVCIGNDVRVPASNPSASTAGQSVVSNGSRVVYRGDVGRWWNSGITPGSTAVTADCIAVGTTPAWVKVGHPIRILDTSGMVYNTDIGAPKILSTDIAITGLNGERLDRRGCLWFKIVIVSGTQCRVDLYNDEWCEAGNLVGHTGQFDTVSNTTVTLTVTADNGAGLGGSFKIDTRSSSPVETTHSVQFFKTGVISGVDNSNSELYFNGQELSLATGVIKEVWFGSPELVVWVHGQIVGPYAAETINTAIKSRSADAIRWPYGPATIVQCHASHTVNDTGATQPKMIPVIDGVAAVADASAPAMTLNPALANILRGATSPASLRVTEGVSVEMRTVMGTNGNARNAIFDLLAVLD